MEEQYESIENFSLNEFCECGLSFEFFLVSSKILGFFLRSFSFSSSFSYPSPDRFPKQKLASLRIFPTPATFSEVFPFCSPFPSFSFLSLQAFLTSPPFFLFPTDFVPNISRFIPSSPLPFSSLSLPYHHFERGFGLFRPCSPPFMSKMSSPSPFFLLPPPPPPPFFLFPQNLFQIFKGFGARSIIIYS